MVMQWTESQGGSGDGGGWGGFGFGFGRVKVPLGDELCSSGRIKRSDGIMRGCVSTGTKKKVTRRRERKGATSGLFLSPDEVWDMIHSH